MAKSIKTCYLFHSLLACCMRAAPKAPDSVCCIVAVGCSFQPTPRAALLLLTEGRRLRCAAAAALCPPRLLAVPEIGLRPRAQLHDVAVAHCGVSQCQAEGGRAPHLLACREGGSGEERWVSREVRTADTSGHRQQEM